MESKKEIILRKTGNTTEYLLFHAGDNITIPCEVDLNRKREVTGLRILHANRNVRFGVKDFQILDELETAGYTLKRYG